MHNIFWKFRILCVVGLLLSVYATYVELKAERDADYVALCDISPKVSCTAVFTSRYGRGFGLLKALGTWNPPNGVLGIAFYSLLLALTIPRGFVWSLLLSVLCLVSNMLSVYLAYLLYFVLEDFCVICVSIYVVNFFCMIEALKNHKLLSNLEEGKYMKTENTVKKLK